MAFTFNQFAENFSYAADPALWMKAQTQMSPDPWQTEVLRSTSSRLWICNSRQSGKSLITSVASAHRALFIPNQLILILSPSQRQSSELFKKIHEVLRNVETTSFDSETALTCQLSNGSRIVSLSGNPVTARTYSADAIVIDEASRTSDALYRVVRPMLATKPRGQLLLLSTPGSRKGFFWEIHRDQDDSWQRFRVTAEDCPRITQEFLEQERKALPHFIFRREYFCEFPESDEMDFFLEDDVTGAFVDEPGFNVKF